MHDIRSLDSTALFAASDWMRRLARHLIHDDDRAEDLVQETWSAALRNPPRHGASLRVWLGGILRRKALEQHRTEANRHAREVSTAAPEALPSTAELAARADEQRFLIERVLALPFKYRQAVLLRFYENRAPREIAIALELPVDTVRTHLQRGLERLRTDLDRRHPGKKAEWALALAPLAIESKSTPVKLPQDSMALPASTIKLVAACGALALAGVIVAAAFIRPVRGPHTPQVTQSAPRRTGSIGQDQSPIDGQSGDRSFAERHAREPVQIVRGEVIDSLFGSPIPAIVQHGASAMGTAHLGNGKFALALSTDAHAPLIVQHPRYLAREFPSEEFGSKDVDLGRIRLVPQTTANVICLDSSGKPIAGAQCTVQSKDGEKPVDLGRTNARGRIQFPLAQDGVFSMRDQGGFVGICAVYPGCEQISRLDGPARTLRVVDRDTMEPVREGAFDLSWSRSASTLEYSAQTDSHGRIMIPVGAGWLGVENWQFANTMHGFLIKSLEVVTPAGGTHVVGSGKSGAQIPETLAS